MITTDVEQAIQYIREVIFTESGGVGGETLVRINQGNEGNIRLSGDIQADNICDKDGNGCSDAGDLLTISAAMSTNYIPKSASARSVVNSRIIDNGSIVYINNSSNSPLFSVTQTEVIVGNDTALPSPYIFGVRGESIFNGDIDVNGNVNAVNYCNAAGGDCESVTDLVNQTELSDGIDALRTEIVNDYYDITETDANFYNMSYIDTNLYTSGQIEDLFYRTGHIDSTFYDRTYIDGNYYTGGEIDTMFIDLMTTIVNAYYTTGYLDANFVRMNYLTANYHSS